MRALLISTYDLGRQPFGLASAAAALHESGVDVRCLDLSRDRFLDEEAAAAGLIGFFLPMHTAARLAVPVIRRVRTQNPGARLCAYGLYAPLNAELLRDLGVEIVLGAEFEDDLAAIGRDLAKANELTVWPKGKREIARVTFRIPNRTGLPPLSRYAALQTPSGSRVTGYTEASRGCKHRCRHCPIVPVYDGRFRVVPVDVVMADIRAQVGSGAQHVTFGDPDFFNGIKHADAVLRAFAAEFPQVSYDVTIKIEHLLRHADRLPLLRETGCVFVTSAVESLDDRVLERLAKGHTRTDFERVVQLFREAGLTLAPTFVAFTPWTTIESYCDLLETIDRLDLIDHVSPIQLAIRLLITGGSLLLELSEVRALTTTFDPVTMTYPWRHPDPRVDALQAEIAAEVGVRATADRRELFARAWTPAHHAAGSAAPMRAPLPSRASVPYLNEPWYC
jgi:radical SAM superfamily enzyme YgiQ (UPF0313 family)